MPCLEIKCAHNAQLAPIVPLRPHYRSLAQALGLSSTLQQELLPALSAQPATSALQRQQRLSLAPLGTTLLPVQLCAHCALQGHHVPPPQPFRWPAQAQHPPSTLLLGLLLAQTALQALRVPTRTMALFLAISDTSLSLELVSALSVLLDSSVLTPLRRWHAQGQDLNSTL